MFDEPAELALLARLVETALEPGAGADLQYAIGWWGWGPSPGSPTPVPPMLFDTVRVTGVVYVPSGGANQVAGIRSQHILSAGALAQASGGTPFALPVAYVEGHPMELTWGDGNAFDRDAPVIASIDPALVPAEGGLVAEIDTDTGTATLRAVGFDEFSMLSGYSVQQLRDFLVAFTNGIVPDDTRAEPQWYDPDDLFVD